MCWSPTLVASLLFFFLCLLCLCNEGEGGGGRKKEWARIRKRRGEGCMANVFWHVLSVGVTGVIVFHELHCFLLASVLRR